MPDADMTKVVAQLLDWLKLIVALGGALIAIRQWVTKPLDKLDKKTTASIEAMQKEAKQNKADLDRFCLDLKRQMHDVRQDQMSQDYVLTFMSSDRMATAHAYWMKKGYCPEPDRSRLIDMYQQHKARGANHLSGSYISDLQALPKTAPKKEENP